MRALVLSSGGLKAGWQVGVIKALAEEGVSWDVVCGCSAGSMNAAIMCMYDKGDEIRASDHLERIWVDYAASKQRPSCVVPSAMFSAMTRSASIKSDSLLYDICSGISVQKLRNSNRQLYVLANSLSSGGRVFSKKYPRIKQAIVASMTVPGMFPPQRLELPNSDSELFVDGAMSTSIPHFINGMDVDIVMANSLQSQYSYTQEMAPPSLVMSAYQALDAGMNQTSARSVETLRRNNNLVSLYEPPSDLQRKNFYELTKDDVLFEIESAYNHTKQTVTFK